MRHRLESTPTWKTKGCPSLRTKLWGCTVQYGMQMTGPHKVVGSRQIGPMHPSLQATRALKSMPVSAQFLLQQQIAQRSAAAVEIRSIGGMSLHCQPSISTRTTSSCGSRLTTCSMTTALILLGFQWHLLSVFITATRVHGLGKIEEEKEKLCIKDRAKKGEGLKSYKHVLHVFFLFCSLWSQVVW